MSVMGLYGMVVLWKKSFKWEDVFLVWWMRAKMDLIAD